MPIYQHYADKIFQEMKSGLISELGNNKEFLDKIENDSDWSFLIKVQTLIEASLTDALVQYVGEPKTKRLFERLSLSDNQIGKISLAKDFEILDKGQRKFVCKLSEIRNNLAHRADHVDFSLLEYLGNLDKSQLDSWQKTICWFPVGNGTTQTFWNKLAVEKPRLAIWFSTYLLLTFLRLAVIEKKASRSTMEAALKTAEELYASIADANEG